ncbi:MAG: 3-deoxy-D-manno-octulosonic acid transferase [Hyphomicrobiaceae bacterium]
MAGTTSEMVKGRQPEQPNARPSPLGLKVYRSLTWLARPAARFILRQRLRRGKEDPDRLGERMGIASRTRPAGEVAWVHAASVGEANAVLPLIEELGLQRPGLTVVLTTGTVTSARSIMPRLPAHALHQYVPLDAPQLVGRFLDHWRPCIGIFTEQEVWPNLLMESAARGIPLALVNGRMSEESARRWLGRPALAKALFSRFDVVLAQSETYAQRFAQLGARDARNVGNLKIDVPPLPVDATARARLAEACGSRPLLLAASTHDGEERIVADAHGALASLLPGLLTIIAPRHPDRGPAIADDLTARGLTVTRRAAGALPDAATDIYLADTIGELGLLYALAPVALVGGALVEHGGQNPIEAVRLGSVVMTGPHRWNFEEAYDALIANGGGFTVANADELAERAHDLLTHDQTRATACRGAQEALARLGGALERTIERLLPLLAPTGAKARART